MLWGGSLNFSTTKFAKDPRILNMVMTFVLTPWSHYNTITEPHACFLLSFMEDLFIDFPSYMIESIIEVYRDITTRDKLIFPSAITLILTHMHVTFLPSSLFYVIGAINKSLSRGVQNSWLRSGLVWRRWMQPLPLDPLLHLPLLPPLGQMSLMLTSWISFSTWVLILVVISTICLMRCIK